jgi:hypothetical protein
VFHTGCITGVGILLAPLTIPGTKFCQTPRVVYRVKNFSRDCIRKFGYHEIFCSFMSEEIPQ